MPNHVSLQASSPTLHDNHGGQLQVLLLSDTLVLP